MTTVLYKMAQSRKSTTPKGLVNVNPVVKTMSKMELFYGNSSEDESVTAGTKNVSPESPHTKQLESSYGTTSRYNLRQTSSRDSSCHSDISCGSDLESDKQSKGSASKSKRSVQLKSKTQSSTRSKNPTVGGSSQASQKRSTSKTSSKLPRKRSRPFSKTASSTATFNKQISSGASVSVDTINPQSKTKRRKQNKLPCDPAHVLLRKNDRGALVAFDNSDALETSNPPSNNPRRGFIPALNASSTNLWNPLQMVESQTVQVDASVNDPPVPDQRLIIVNNCIYKFQDPVPNEIQEISEPFYVTPSGTKLQKESLTLQSVEFEEIFLVPVKLSSFYLLHGFYFGHKKLTSDTMKKIQRKGFQDSAISASFYVYCRICRKLKSCNGGAAANFGRHLKDIHKLLNPSSMNLGVMHIDENGCASYGLAERYKWDNAKQITGLDLLLQYMMDCNLPFSSVEKFSLKRLLNFFDPQFVLPSKHTVSSLLTRKVESEVMKILKETLNNVDSATLVVDAWSSKSMQGVLAVSIVFIDTNFDWQKNTISISRIVGSHTAQNISGCILSVISKWSLEGKVRFIVSDGGSNMVCSLAALHELAKDEEWGSSILLELDLDNQKDSHEDEGSSNLIEEESILNPVAETNDDQNITIGDVTHVLGFSNAFCVEGDSLVSKQILNTTDIVKTHEISAWIGDIYQENMKPSKCVAHTSQRVLADGSKNEKASQIEKTIKKVAAFGRKRQVVREISKAMTGKVAKRPCTTRWNSVVDSGWTLWEPDFFELMLYLIDDARQKASEKALKSLPDPLTEDFHEELHEFLLVSDPICKLTDELQADGITAHLVIPGIARASQALRSLTQLKHMEEYRQTILGSFERRMISFVNDNEFIFATVLCPYYKLAFFELYFEDNSTEEENTLNMPSLDTVKGLCYTHLRTPAEMEPSFVRQSSLSSSVVQSKCPFAQRILERETQQLEVSESKESDFTKYIAQKVVMESPMIFWKNMKETLPRLYEKAREVFSKPATSGLVERLFSLIADINTSDRSNMNIKTMEEIVLYKEFIKLPRSYKEATSNIFDANEDQLIHLVEQLSISPFVQLKRSNKRFKNSPSTILPSENSPSTSLQSEKS